MADKILRLTDNNPAGFAQTELSTDADHQMVIGVVEYEMRMSEGNKRAFFQLYCGANLNLEIYFGIVPQTIRLRAGGGEDNLGAWAANTWYKFRVYFDCVARSVVVFVDNVWKAQQALWADEKGNYMDKIRFKTFTDDSGYYVDINNLKVFNLTV